MKTEANWRRGVRYYWVHKSVLACSFIGGGKLTGPRISILLERPKEKPEDYHRCEIVVVRTKREAADLDRKWAKRRALRVNGLAALLAKNVDVEVEKARGSCLTGCQADLDGECHAKGCPQLRDGEPEKSGRFCPLPATGLVALRENAT